MVDLLSMRNIVESIETSKCLNNHCSQTTSLTIDDKIRYYNSIKDLDVVPCLTNFQEIEDVEHGSFDVSNSHEA